MALGAHSIQPAKGSKREKKRVGRGLGSTGSYSGKGVKGQKARSGVSGLKRLGNKRLILSTPKLRGFKSLQPKAGTVNVGLLAKYFEAGSVVSGAVLKEKGLVRSSAATIKVLGSGEIKHALTIEGCQISASAKEKITAAGGTIR